MLSERMRKHIMFLFKEKKVILCVDDSAVTLRTVKGILQRKYKVILANSCDKMYFQLRKVKPDLILLDYVMPDKTGADIYRELEANKDYKDIPIVFMSGVDSKTIIEKDIGKRNIDYVLKPTLPDVLMNIVNQVLVREDYK